MRPIKIITKFLLIITLCNCFEEDDDFIFENDILVLTASNFDKALSKYDYLFVMFYAPWCSYCKKFKPELEKAANILSKENLIVGKIDGTIEKNLADKYDIKAYPTMKFFIKGTPFDFTKEKKIGKDIKAVGVGYDHCYVTEKYDPSDVHCGLPLEDNDLVEFCTVKDPASGHEMSVFTNMEGCQFYTGNWIKGIIGKNGRVYDRHDGFCLETQCFPDTPNQKDFPTCILEPGQKMKAKTVYSFTFNK